MISSVKAQKSRLKYLLSYNDEVLTESTPDDLEIKYVEIGDVKFDQGITNHTEYTFEKSPSRARRIVRDGDVILSTVRTYLKAVAGISKPPENLIVSTGFVVLRPNNLVFHPRFASYFFQTEYLLREVVSKSVGVSYPAVRPEDIVNMGVDIPPLETQKKIADFLDKETTRIDTLISKKQKQIELLQEKRQAIITQSVTKGLNPYVKMKNSGVEWIGEIPEHWDSIKLKYISTKVNSGKTPRGGSESYRDDGIMLIRSQNVYFDGLRLNDVVFIDDDTDKEMRHSRVRPKDVLLNITGASIGRSYYVPEDFPSSNVNQHVCIIRPDHHKIMTEYLWLCMASSVIQRVIFSNEKGTSREGITFEQIRIFDIPLPKDLEEQSLIVENILNEIDRNDRTVLTIQSSIALLKEYRSSLITHAVSGQIDISKYEVSK